MAGVKGAAVLVTGASSGIGGATALAFARRHARLVLCARRLDRLQAVAERCREAGAAEVVIRKADVSRAAEARAFVATGLQQYDRVDVLVNNAGFGWRGRLTEMSQEEVEALIGTNLMGTIWTSQAALPHMVEAGSGVVINVASVVGFRAVPYSAVYSASKYAVVGLSHALRGELSGSGVKVCVVYPASTKTEFFAATEAPIGPQYSAAWVARLIVRTARFPRRDAMVLPYRLVDLAEPVCGGLLDHSIGEARRLRSPHVGGSGLPPAP